MHEFKLRAEDAISMPIERDIFESATECQPPWHVPGSGDNQDGRQYGVCPCCNNPVQIVGLYRPSLHTDKPFGSHTGKRMEGFPHFDPQALDWCPFIVDNQKKTRNRRDRRDMSEVDWQILAIALSQFDRIMYILEHDTGIRFTDGFAKKLIRSWLMENGYRYPGCHLRNVPWMVAYLARPPSLFNQKVSGNADLRAAIGKNVPAATFNANGRLIKGKRFYEIGCSFILHKSTITDGGVSETITLSLSSGLDKRRHPRSIYRQKITCDPEYFEYLVNLPPGRASRNPQQLGFADEAFRERFPGDDFAEIQRRAALLES